MNLTKTQILAIRYGFCSAFFYYERCRDCPFNNDKSCIGYVKARQQDFINNKLLPAIQNLFCLGSAKEIKIFIDGLVIYSSQNTAEKVMKLLCAFETIFGTMRTHTSQKETFPP